MHAFALQQEQPGAAAADVTVVQLEDSLAVEMRRELIPRSAPHGEMERAFVRALAASRTQAAGRIWNALQPAALALRSAHARPRPDNLVLATNDGDGLEAVVTRLPMPDAGAWVRDLASLGTAVAADTDEHFVACFGRSALQVALTHAEGFTILALAEHPALARHLLAAAIRVGLAATPLQAQLHTRFRSP